jgi:hypothetical protein
MRYCTRSSWRAVGLLLLAGAGQKMEAQSRALTFEEIGSQPACRPAIVPSRECFRHQDSARRGAPFAARAPDHRYEGLAIGAAVGAAVGILGGLAVCGQSDDPDTSCAKLATAGGLGLGLLGGLTGLLIGAQFPKEPEAAPPDSAAS